MTSRARIRRPLASSPFAAVPEVPVKVFAVNDRVTHDRYGLGTVVGVEQEIAVLVDFGSRRERIPSPFPKLNLL